MKRDEIDASIDRIADDAKETVDLLAERIDSATRCGRAKVNRIKRSAKKHLRHATDSVQQRVDRTADRIREKLED